MEIKSSRTAHYEAIIVDFLATEPVRAIMLSTIKAQELRIKVVRFKQSKGASGKVKG